MDLAAAVADLHRRRAEMESLLERLVAINSFSENKAGVDRCGAILGEALADAGLRARVHRRSDVGDHWVFESPACADATRRWTLLLGHLDTVFAPGTFEGFHRERDRATGPGTYDMKGGLVVVAFALKALHAAGVLSRVPVALAAISDEEAGSVDGREILRSLWPRAACALGFESGRDQDRIVTRRKGTGYLRVEAFGRAAHAGNAHADGANAIWALARFIDRAQAQTDYARGVAITVGRVRGGQARNAVPDHCECDVDLRYDNIGDGEDLVRRLEAAAAEAAVPGTRLLIHPGSRRPPLVRTDASAALAAEYGAGQRAAGLGDGEAPLAGGGSDASFASETGVPAIDGLGPRGSGFHTREEQVDLASLVPKAEALVRFLWGRTLR